MAQQAKTLTKAQIKAKARRAAKQARMGETAALAYGVSKEIRFAETQEGDRVRLDGAKSFDEAQAFCTGRRGYDIFEIREELGDNWVRYMVTQGYAVPFNANEKKPTLFLLTTKAQKVYGLPTHINGGMPANYAKVA